MNTLLWILLGIFAGLGLWVLLYLIGLLIGAARYAVVWTDLDLSQDTFTLRGARHRLRWHQQRAPTQTYRIWDRLHHKWITP